QAPALRTFVRQAGAPVGEEGGGGDLRRLGGIYSLSPNSQPKNPRFLGAPSIAAAGGGAAWGDVGAAVGDPSGRGLRPRPRLPLPRWRRSPSFLGDDSAAWA